MSHLGDLTFGDKSELETLKAQLAQWKRIVQVREATEQMLTEKLCESEAQVRELRELIGVVIGVRRLPDILPLIVVERLEKAALRSAPPSGQLTNRHGQRVSQECFEGRHEECKDTVFGPNACCCTYRGAHTTAHAYATIPFDKPNAGEERKDYVQSSDATQGGVSATWAPAGSSQQRAESAGALASEQVPAGGDVRKTCADSTDNARESIPTNQAVMNHPLRSGGPQDSPSRSEWISVEEKPAPFDEAIIAAIEYKSGGCLLSETIVCVNRGGDLETELGDDIGWPDEVITHWRPLPSPAREKEKAE